MYRCYSSMELENGTGGLNMTEAAKEARRAYKRKWNRDNPDKVKAAQERYWTKKAQEAAEQEQEATPTQEATA